MLHRNAAYAAMVESLDDSVGRVTAHLKQRKLAGNTMVLFMSGNGGYIYPFEGQPVTNNSPLRSGKGSLCEGGLRVPLIGLRRKKGADINVRALRKRRSLLNLA